MKIYTKTGDKGTSSLFSGRRVPKDHPLLDAYGEVDELNSHIGLLISFLNNTPHESLKKDLTLLPRVQSWLFTFGSYLACDSETMQSKLPAVSDSWALDLENAIDQHSEDLPALTGFILPGGTTAAAQAQVCRTICRRAERKISPLLRGEDIHSNTKTLNIQTPAHIELMSVNINRLSDYFFSLARFINHFSGKSDELWVPDE